MKEESKVSEERINAFVDGELSDRERVELLTLASGSNRLQQRLCETLYLKELVREAHPEPSPELPVSSERRYFLTHAAAAGAGALALATGLLTWNPDGGETALMSALQPGADGQDITRVVFHISSADPDTAGQLLEQVELVLSEYAERKKSVRVEVVANNLGLRLLQKGHSPFPERIKALHQRFPNLMFAACSNTMERLRRDHGEQVEVLPESVVIRSGVSYVARRQQQGWVYIKA